MNSDFRTWNNRIKQGTFPISVGYVHAIRTASLCCKPVRSRLLQVADWNIFSSLSLSPLPLRMKVSKLFNGSASFIYFCAKSFVRRFIICHDPFPYTMLYSFLAVQSMSETNTYTSLTRTFIYYLGAVLLPKICPFSEAQVCAPCVTPHNSLTTLTGAQYILLSTAMEDLNSSET
jgi:hypothetical protein